MTVAARRLGWKKRQTISTASCNPTLFRSGSGDEPYSRGQWDTALRATPQSPEVMIRVIDACEQPARSAAHGFRSHRPRSLLTLRKFCRIRAGR
jgi:hypothetical protein